ncbi:MAG: Spy/CpxP family protein refolding chaperone [Actinomycetota bacterium]
MTHIPRRVAAGLLTAALSLSLMTASLAQRGRGGGGGYPAAIITRLALTDEQKAKVQAAADALKAENQAAQALTTPKEKRQAGKAARDKYAAAVKSALTPDQQTRLDAMLAEAKQFPELGPQAGQMAGLNLTDEQKAKVKEIGVRYQPELQKLRASQKDASDKQAVMAQIREQQGKMMTEIRAVLTPEQRKQLGGGRKKQK